MLFVRAQRYSGFHDVPRVSGTSLTPVRSVGVVWPGNERKPARGRQLATTRTKLASHNAASWAHAGGFYPRFKMMHVRGSRHKVDAVAWKEVHSRSKNLRLCGWFMNS